MKAAYRPDIDGMRAVSVVAVILYHFGVPGFSGGFVGVDVFFVISGYLITRQLLEYRGTGVLAALGDFYLRRARRILPASLVMLAVVTGVATVMFLPFDLERLGKSVAMGASFLGNVAAWQSRNYFLAGDTPAPLLHLWSLAVEEQFYLVFPVLLLTMGTSLPRARRLVLVVAVMSFAMCAWAYADHPAFAFYSTPSRAWELMLGALLALGLVSEIRQRARRELYAVLGIVALMSVICVGGAGTDFWSPWVHSLVPCIAAMLLIQSSGCEPTRVARALSLRPVVFVGLISYSLYLWHLPVHVLAQYYFVLPLTITQQCGLMVAIFGLAVLSWRFVELPVRRRQWLSSSRELCSVASALTVTLVCAGAAVWTLEGVPRRFPPEIVRLADTSRRYHEDAVRCSQLPTSAVASGDLCVVYAATLGARSMVLWGDSHALSLLPAFESLARSNGWRLYFAMRSACRPLLATSAPLISPQSNAACIQFNSAMLEALRRLQPDRVALAAYWDLPNGELPKGRFGEALEQTVRQIDTPGRRACIVRDAPDYRYPIPFALARASIRGIDVDRIRMSSDEARARFPEMEQTLERLTRQQGVTIVDPKDRLCDGELCRLVDEEGRPVYADSNHLNIVGAMFVRDSLGRCFDASP
jgi:peptidoglycan/LPS O-acetylase OafA/YrhL